MRTLGMSLSCLVRQWRCINDERLKPLGLTQSRWITLSHLQQEEGLQQHQLAKWVGVESPSMVRTLDGLEASGLIERRPYANDRRSKTVHLTAAAHAMLNEMQAVLEQTRSQILAGLSTSEIEQFERVVTHLNHNLQRLCAEQD